MEENPPTSVVFFFFEIQLFLSNVKDQLAVPDYNKYVH